jgi:rare lipoprotein A (peptidoglycan hydrolase)
MIDVSYKAAVELGIITAGVARVEISVFNDDFYELFPLATPKVYLTIPKVNINKPMKAIKKPAK